MGVEWPPAYGKPTVIGNQLWMRCVNCGKPVRINKPIFGGWHICATDQEIMQRTQMQNNQAELAESYRRASQIAEALNSVQAEAVQTPKKEP